MTKKEEIWISAELYKPTAKGWYAALSVYDDEGENLLGEHFEPDVLSVYYWDGKGWYMDPDDKIPAQNISVWLDKVCETEEAAEESLKFISILKEDHSE